MLHFKSQNKIKSITYHYNNRRTYWRFIKPLSDRAPTSLSSLWPEFKVQSVRLSNDICGLPHHNSCRGILGPAKQRSRSRLYQVQSFLSSVFGVHCSAIYRSLYNSSIMSAKLKQKKVCIIGSGNWGSAIAKIIGNNTVKHEHFHDIVTMYVYEEEIDGRKLTDIINETHENIKYLPGIKLPENIVAVPDLVEAAQDADILIFVIPHQFIRKICCTLLDKIKPTACGLSLIKGFDHTESGNVELISHVIEKYLHISCNVLMGANIAQEVAEEQFCESTIGCKDKEMAPYFLDLMQSDNFRIVVVEDVPTVEVCGALKNIIALGCGFADGLGYGDNTKAAVIRLGLMEMVKFVDTFYPGGKLSTFFESCGIADLITTCYGGRNKRLAKAFVTEGKPFSILEREMLNGQKLQGPITAQEINTMLKAQSMEDSFPVFTVIHRICQQDAKPSDIIAVMQKHPEHSKSMEGSFNVRSSL